MGNGPVRHAHRLETPVHPHAYGERAGQSHRDCRRGGSSPRIWGTVDTVFWQDAKHRFIPTHMGNGWHPSPPWRKTSVHPHAYGERNRAAVLAYSVSRFIPTHMGNGPIIARFFSASAVHPHAYGERRRWPGKFVIAPGSSPRIWGTGVPDHVAAFEYRFIPTHMGNGLDFILITQYPTVHPHAYGERKI